jgi:hypothetical protein
MTEKEWLSIPEAARLMRRGYNVVYRLCLTGELRSQRQGARLFVNRGDVLRLVRRWREGERARVGAAG